MCAMGYDDRPPTADELEHMKRLLAEALEQGAVGLSTGLTYTPGMYADDDEIVALLEARGADGARVVTSDAELARRARALGAEVQGAGAFRRRLDEAAG